uniref:LisH domain-containing protein n=1 Tax=Triatoma infestans TaxID=30076 RepID=A0A023EWG0_TRIIF
MESLVPTEIARLVYGYLIEVNCESAARLFLETSLHLKECLMVTKKGRRFNTQVSGHNLVDILDKLCEVTSIVKTHIDKNISDSTADTDLLAQLRAVLIPEEKKKVRYKITEPLKNVEVLPENQDSGTNLYHTDVSPLQETNENILDGLCQLAYTSQPNTLHKCNNELDRTGESTICEDTNSKGQQVSDSNTDVLTSGSNIKEKCDNKVNTSAKNDSFLGTVQQLDTESNPRNSQTIQFGIENQLCNSETTEKKEIEIQNNVTTELPVNSLNPATISDSTFNISSLNLASSTTSFSSTSLPMAVTHVCNQTQPTLTNIRLQLNNSPKIHVSLVNQHQTAQENDYLKNSQHPLTATYSLYQPFVGSPTAIYIKPPLKNPIIKNIFTGDNRPVEKPSEKFVVIKQATATSVANPNREGSCLKNENELSSETNPKKNDKHMNDAPVIKRSGVRTRGGYVKRGGKYQRRVKAHLPHKIAVQSDKTDLSTGNEQNSVESPKSCNTEVPNVNADTTVIQSSVIDRNLSENAQVTTTQPNQADQLRKITECGTIEKSEQTTKNLRKRISLSVPRRGSHIRALDFKTPTKNNIYTRRAITSPKQIHASRSSSFKKSLRNLRGALFKSPIQKNENKAWDADLRKYTAECIDIPTSVGLQRKKNIQTSNGNVTDKTRCSSTKSPKNAPLSDGSSSEIKSEVALLKKVETNDDLADKIQKEVLSVIGEEDINLLGENTTMIIDSDLDKIIREDKATPTTNNKQSTSNEMENYIEKEQSPNNSLQVREKVADKQNSQTITGTSNIFEAEDRSNFLEMSSSPLVTPVSKVLLEHRQTLENGLLTPGTLLTPNNLCITTTPLKETISAKQETPLMKLVSPNISLTCQDSLEASLIKECKRIESENLRESIEGTQKDDVFKRKSETDTPEKSVTKLNYENNFINIVSNNSEDSPSSPLINQEVEIGNEMNNKKSDLNIANSFIGQTSPNTEVQNISSHSSPNLVDISAELNNSVEEDNTSEKISEDNAVMNSGNHSNVQFFAFRNKVNLTKKIDSAVDKLCKNHRKEMNNTLLAPLEEKNSHSEESPKRMPQKTIKSKSEQLKVKSRKSTKTEIDCTKLIAQCLQSAKENLYGSKNKLSPLTTSTPNTSKTECKNNSSKINRQCNSSPNKKCKNNRSRKISCLSKRIKNINALLFTDSTSSTSQDSDISLVLNEKSELKKIDNHDQTRSSAKKHSNDQNSLVFPDKPRTDSEENSEDNSGIDREKEERSFVENTSKLEELSLQKQISAKKHSNDQNSLVVPDKPRTDSEENSEDNSCINKEKEERSFLENTSKLEQLLLQKQIHSKEREGNKVMSPNLEKRSDLSTKLSNYIYTFTLTVDGANVTKQLKVSPFYNIFEMESTSETPNKFIKRSGKEIHSQLDSKDRSRKRKLENDKEITEMPVEGSSKSSFSDEKKINSNKKYKRESDFTYKDSFHNRSERRRNYRYDEPRHKRSSRIGVNSYVRDNYLQRYRHEYTPPRFRRYPSSSRRWTARRKSTRVELSPKVETPKWNSYRPKESLSSESTHRYPKERADAKKHEEIKKCHDFGSRVQFKNENGKSRSNGTTYSKKSVKDRKEQRISFDKEDGELSESSLSAYSLTPALLKAARETQRIAENMPPVNEDTRAKLKKVNLDHFLSILHGTEK